MKIENNKKIRKLTSASYLLGTFVAPIVFFVCMLLELDFLVPPLLIFMLIDFVLFIIHRGTYTYEEILLGEDDDWKLFLKKGKH